MADGISRRAFVGLAGLLLTACAPKRSASSAASPTGASPSAESATPSRTPTLSASPASSPSARPTTASPSPYPDRFPAGIINLLVIGSDVPGDWSGGGGNADCICVVQIAADRKRLNMVSIARDSLVRRPNGYVGKINAVYHAEGAEGLAAAVSDVLGGLPIHGTIATAFVGFRSIAEKMGGFTVNNLHYSDSFYDMKFPVGMIRIPGMQAIYYVRERKPLPNGDLDRTERHRAALTGMLMEFSQMLKTKRAFTETLARTLWPTVRVTGGLTVEHALGLLWALQDVQRPQVTSVIVPVAYFDTVDGAFVDVLNAPRTDELAVALKAGDLAGYVRKYGTGNAPTG